ncbi:MAG: DNA-directed RNA polymerase subunit alpha C-terminal domain-containing protein, partial [Bacteroidota bacterium]
VLQEGFLAVDTFFIPGISCGYHVETNTSGKSKFDEITLTITTNGSVSPDDVLKISSEKLKGIFEAINMGEVESTLEEEDEEDNEELLETKIEDTTLSIRAKNCLLKYNINTVLDLVERTAAELRSLSGFGSKSSGEIIEFLKLNNLQFGRKITKRRKI